MRGKYLKKVRNELARSNRPIPKKKRNIAEKVVCLNSNGKILKTYTSAKDATTHIGGSDGSIRQSIIEGYSYRGFHWGYLIRGKVFRAKPKPAKNRMLLHGKDRYMSIQKFADKMKVTRRVAERAIYNKMFRGEKLEKIF